MNSGIENNNRNSIKYRPITFDSAKKMFTYLQDVGDLYSPDEQCDVDYAKKFCEYWYKSEWYDTRDYADLVL